MSLNSDDGYPLDHGPSKMFIERAWKLVANGHGWTVLEAQLQDDGDMWLEVENLARVLEQNDAVDAERADAPGTP